MQTTLDIALEAIKKLEKYEKKEAQKLWDLLYNQAHKENEKILGENRYNSVTF